MITVKKLKEILKDWPDTNDDGEDTEVWVETSKCTTSPAVFHFILNRKKHDLLLSPFLVSDEQEEE